MSTFFVGNSQSVNFSSKSFTQARRIALRMVWAVPLLSLTAGMQSGTAWAGISTSQAQEIGLTQLLQTNSSLTGAGVNVGQVEGDASNSSSSGWGYEPSPGAMGSKITYYDWKTSTPTADAGYNAVYASGHATTVADTFYNGTGSVAPGVAHVNVFEATNYWTYVISGNQTMANQPSVVNQSFGWVGATAGQIQAYDYFYDNYADLHNTLFVSAVGDGQTTGTTPTSQINAPSTAYNGIAVAAYGGSTGVGLTYDGRSKPDITAPGSATSFTAPIVSGVAAIIHQAANENLGGTGTASMAADARTIKVLLLNGAVKPVGWTHTATQPLDTRYGAGIVNAYNSYRQLTAGRQTPVTSTTVTSSSGIPGAVSSGASTHLSGWDFNTITTSSSTMNTANHYVFNLSPSLGSTFSLTATITWNMQYNQTKLNNLDLYLYNSSGQRIALSNSSVDNVQQIYDTNLAAGVYDLQVVKLGAAEVSTTETYSMAYDFTGFGGTQSVPEPAALGMLAVGLGILLIRRPKHPKT